MNAYRPNPTIIVKEGSWGKAIWKGLLAYLGMGVALGLIFGGNWSDWMGWVALVVGILNGLGSLLDFKAACPYCHNQLTFSLEPKELQCGNCKHRAQVDVANRLLIPLDMLPAPIQTTSQQGGSSSGWGKVASAGLAGLALGTLIGEAAAEEIPQETPEDTDSDIVDSDIDVA